MEMIAEVFYEQSDVHTSMFPSKVSQGFYACLGADQGT